MCVLTDLVLLQFGDWLQKNTLSNYLERAPGHWESHYIITNPPTHTGEEKKKGKKKSGIRPEREIVEGRRETKDEKRNQKNSSTAKPQRNLSSC